MSQDEIETFLKTYLGEQFTASEIGRFLNEKFNVVNLYRSLEKLRPKCRFCGGLVEDSPNSCPWCHESLIWESGVRCTKVIHREDGREAGFIYWWEDSE